MSLTPRYERIAGPQVVSGKIIDPWLVCAIDTGTFFARFVILNTGLPLKILVTGACGYKGTVLVPKLLLAGFEVVALDTMWFGNFLGPHECLTVIKGDVCQADSIDLEGIDAIIHLASIANDPCGDLEPKLTWEVSALSTMRLADKAVRHGVKQSHLDLQCAEDQAKADAAFGLEQHADGLCTAGGDRRGVPYGSKAGDLHHW